MLGPEERPEAAHSAVARGLSGADARAADGREGGARRGWNHGTLQGRAQDAQKAGGAGQAALLRLQHRVTHFRVRERRGLTLQARKHDARG